jgi:hypothetical protein
MRQRLFAGSDARRAKHYNRVAHFLSAQPLKRVNVFRHDAHGPRRQAFHEQRIAVRRIYFPGMALATHQTSTDND